VDRRAILRNADGSLAGLVVAGRLGGGLTGGGLVGRAGAQTVPAPEGASLALDPFMLGVSSGDPMPDSVVLWTRLAPDPLHGGGMPSVPIPVQWEVSTDERFTSLTQRGTVLATPEWGHSVHAEVRGLEPHRWYWYRFRVGGDISPVGRTRTAAAPQTGEQRLRMAFVSCQMYEHGYFTAYRHLAEEDLDLVVHLGDYIYEHGPNEYQVASGNVRLHDGPEVDGLESYRNRHALYKTDPDLQIAHGRFPWIVTWDDHEVDNNWADEIPEDEDFDIQAFLVAGPTPSRPTTSTCRSAARPCRPDRTWPCTDGCASGTWPSSASSTPVSTAATRPAATGPVRCAPKPSSPAAP
jgi:alkaline phosphatase D